MRLKRLSKEAFKCPIMMEVIRRAFSNLGQISLIDKRLQILVKAKRGREIAASICRVLPYALPLEPKTTLNPSSSGTSLCKVFRVFQTGLQRR